MVSCLARNTSLSLNEVCCECICFGHGKVEEQVKRSKLYGECNGVTRKWLRTRACAHSLLFGHFDTCSLTSLIKFRGINRISFHECAQVLYTPSTTVQISSLSTFTTSVIDFKRGHRTCSYSVIQKLVLPSSNAVSSLNQNTCYRLDVFSFHTLWLYPPSSSFYLFAPFAYGTLTRCQ